MKKKIALLTFFACLTSSCAITYDGKIVPLGRVYEPFGSMDEVQVENVCKTYAQRIKDPSVAKHVYLVQEMGVFDNVYVDMLKLDLSSLGMATTEVCVDVVLYGTYICYRPNPSYDVNVYVDGDGSYSLKDAYDKGILNDDNIKTIAKWKTFNTSLEDFSFKFSWDNDCRHSYDSKTQQLIKDYNPSNGKTREDYTTTFAYPDLEGLYEKVKEMNLYSFPTNFDPYEGANIATNPNIDYQLEIDDKTIYAYNCPYVSGYPEGIMSQGKKYLELVFEIIDTIQNSDEWKSLPELEPRAR